MSRSVESRAGRGEVFRVQAHLFQLLLVAAYARVERGQALWRSRPQQRIAFDKTSSQLKLALKGRAVARAPVFGREDSLGAADGRKRLIMFRVDETRTHGVLYAL